MAEHTVWQLTRLADCADPDSNESPGAQFLVRIANAAAEEIEGDPSDVAHEIANSAVPIYTFDLWRTFTDLAAWDEDLDELGGSTSDMTANAAAALYLIGSRLAHALLEQDENNV